MKKRISRTRLLRRLRRRRMIRWTPEEVALGLLHQTLVARGAASEDKGLVALCQKIQREKRKIKMRRQKQVAQQREFVRLRREQRRLLRDVERMPLRALRGPQGRGAILHLNELQRALTSAGRRWVRIPW